MDQNKFQIQQYLYNELKQKSQIPEEYWNYSLSDYDFYDSNGKESLKKKSAYAKTLNYIKNLEENLKNGIGLYYYGPRYSKCGLSLLGTYVLRAALEHLRKVLYIEFTSFCLDLTDYDVDINFYYDIDYLMLDSIDSTKSLKNSKVHDTFADILSYRRSKKKPIIFCSYQHYKLFSTEYCKSIESYVENYCDFVDISIDIRTNFTIQEMIIFLKSIDESNRIEGNPNKHYTREGFYKLIQEIK